MGHGGGETDQHVSESSPSSHAGVHTRSGGHRVSHEVVATATGHAAAAATDPLSTPVMAQGDKMQTRMRAGSVIRPPRHADDPPATPPSHPSPPSLVAAAAAAVESSSSSPFSSAMATANHPIAPRTTGRRLSLTSSSNSHFSLASATASHSTSSPSSSSLASQPPLLSAAATDDSSPNSLPRAHHNTRPKPSTSASSPLLSTPSSLDELDARKHPRDFVPPTIGFPAPGMEGRIHQEDLDDRLLMATCAVLHSHENRALCPKELAEVMIARGWLLNAGTTPFAHVSTCIRSHLRRATTSVPPYSPLLTSFELVGSLKDYEVRAVGLRSEDRPAVKRGTLWYLDERVLGKEVGAEDPFIRCQREAGLSPSEKNGTYHRTFPSMTPIAPAPVAMDEDEDDSGMGRGKRKRRASSAAMAAFDTPSTFGGAPATNPSGPVAIPSAPGALATAPLPQRPFPHGHRRVNSMSTPSLSASMPRLGGGMRLTLRLTALEEADSAIEDSDGATSDAQRRRKNKKKPRRATSEGGTGMSRAGSSTGSVDNDDEQDQARSSNAFSSASASALLAKSLLAASQLSPAQRHSRLEDFSSPQSIISPDSLHSGPFSHHTSSRHLSISAPGLFSAFSSATSPDAMDVDAGARRPSPSADADNDSPDEDDFHEAMLRGEDFDFEWSSEAYAAQSAGSATASQLLFRKGKQREASVGLPEHFDSFGKDDELDFDDAHSTPATTPRSPAASRDDEPDVDMAASYKQGMEATLCQAFEQHKDTHAPAEPEDVKPVIAEVVVRAGSSESLASLADDESPDEEEESTQRPERDSAVPLPSPLALLLPHAHLGNQAFSSEYDFVGHEDEDDHLAYRSSYDRDMAESADDEDEEDDIVTVKIEEEGSLGPESAPSSRQSSVYPIESFTQRLTVDVSSSSSSSGSDSDHFDPQMIVTNSMLATGLPVPQVAPSPPDTSDAADWDMHLDLDDLDVDLGGGADLLGPESVGLEELDLAWGGEQGEDETVEEWRARQESKAAARDLATGGASFKTRSPVENRSPPPDDESPRESPRVSPPATFPVVVPAPTSPSSPVSGASRSATPLSRTPTLKPSSTGPVVVYPKIAMSPVVTATIIQRGVAVYATDVVDRDTNETYTLLRRIDTDHINGTILLTGVFDSSEERDSVLRKVSDTFKVIAGGRAVEGTWISLVAARNLAKRYPVLSRLDTFLTDDLGSRFPEPIPTMKVLLVRARAESGSASPLSSFELFSEEAALPAGENPKRRGGRSLAAKVKGKEKEAVKEKESAKDRSSIATRRGRR